jgi:long-chain acyl-CoA synthetase
MPAFVKELRKIALHRDHRREHAVQRPAQHPGFDQVDFSPLHLSLGGGMAVQRAVAERWKQVTGCTLIEAYGLTETSPAACMNPMDLAEYNGAIGLPIPSTDACIKAEDGTMLPDRRGRRTLHPRPAGDEGLLAAPGGDRRSAIDADGWLHTGDMARMDERRLLLHRRPQEGHDPGLGLQRVPERDRGRDRADARRARGRRGRVPDEKSGEAVKVVIVKKDPALTAEQVKAHCPQEPDRVQAAAVRRVPHRAAQDQRRQDPPARAAARAAA